METNTAVITEQTPLQHLLRSAIDAHRGTSFSPEVRGKQFITDYENLLADDLRRIGAAKDDVKQVYQERFIHHLRGYMNAKSRIMSTMITGGSNFPVRRMQKYNKWEENAYKRFNEYRTKAITGIQKQIEREKPAEQKQDEEWEIIRKGIMRSAYTIIDIDNGNDEISTRSLFVSSITGVIKRLAANGKKSHVEKAIALIRDLNAKNKKPLITEKNSIFSLDSIIEAAVETKTDLAKRENTEYPFTALNGGNVVLNYEEDRIQIMFDEKPTKQQLIEYKNQGLNTFRWSPTNEAWQRQLTRNAIWFTNRMLGTEIPA